MFVTNMPKLNALRMDVCFSSCVVHKLLSHVRKSCLVCCIVSALYAYTQCYTHCSGRHLYVPVNPVQQVFSMHAWAGGVPLPHPPAAHTRPTSLGNFEEGPSAYSCGQPPLLKLSPHPALGFPQKCLPLVPHPETPQCPCQHSWGLATPPECAAIAIRDTSLTLRKTSDRLTYAQEVLQLRQRAFFCAAACSLQVQPSVYG